MLKLLAYYWFYFRLRREYVRRLDQVQLNRWVNNKLGLITKERAVVHKWYANEFAELNKKYLR